MNLNKMTFNITEEQEKKIQKWKKKNKINSLDFGATGGGIEYVFIPTGLGMIIEIRCRDKVLDLTEEFS